MVILTFGSEIIFIPNMLKFIYSVIITSNNIFLTNLKRLAPKQRHSTATFTSCYIWSWPIVRFLDSQCTVCLYRSQFYIYNVCMLTIYIASPIKFMKYFLHFTSFVKSSFRKYVSSVLLFVAVHIIHFSLVWSVDISLCLLYVFWCCTLGILLCVS